MKQGRHQLNYAQREGYQQMLVYIKERDGHPMAEEKQLLDCLKLVLDNGWTVGNEELIKLFDLLELRRKVVVSEEFQAFIEFCYLLALMLKMDSSIVEDYFGQEHPTQTQMTFETLHKGSMPFDLSQTISCVKQ